ncbi:hypothetical protein RR46_10888 [Papilio xuthus]|uniref:Uncharacterized protein n=1 Tax=Papilio xuthus TaxID=66420 RepID=A0A194PWS0_PAPXU|nr:hypothetical protein RR46_10888 [Papilio xuthus]
MVDKREALHKMLTMSTLMMPAATMTTMTNAGPIPVAAATKLEPKLLQLPHPALMQQIPQQHHHQHPHGNNKLAWKNTKATIIFLIPHERSRGRRLVVSSVEPQGANAFLGDPGTLFYCT